MLFYLPTAYHTIEPTGTYRLTITLPYPSIYRTLAYLNYHTLAYLDYRILVLDDDHGNGVAGQTRDVVRPDTA